MTRQVLVIGLADTTLPEHAKTFKARVQELYPTLDVLIIVGATNLAVVDLPEQSS